MLFAVDAQGITRLCVRFTGGSYQVSLMEWYLLLYPSIHSSRVVVVYLRDRCHTRVILDPIQPSTDDVHVLRACAAILN